MTDPTSLPPLDPTDDPRLTAYVLGELQGAEREEFERLLGTGPAETAMVEDWRTTADLVSRAVRSESMVGLSLDQRLAIEDALRSRRLRFVRVRRAIMALAAGLLLALGGFGAGVALGPQSPFGARLAMREAVDGAPQAPAASVAGRLSFPGGAIHERVAVEEASDEPEGRMEPAPPPPMAPSSALTEEPSMMAAKAGSPGMGDSGSIASNLTPSMDRSTPAPIPGIEVLSQGLGEGMTAAPGTPPTQSTDTGSAGQGGYTFGPFRESRPGATAVPAPPGPMEFRGTGVAGGGDKPAGRTDLPAAPAASRAEGSLGTAMASAGQVRQKAESDPMARRSQRRTRHGGLPQAIGPGIPPVGRWTEHGTEKLHAKVEQGREVVVQDRQTGALVGQFRNSGEVRSLALSPDNRLVAAADANRLVQVWDLKKGQLIQQLEVRLGEPPAVGFGRGNELLLRSDESGTGEHPFVSPIEQPISILPTRVGRASLAEVRSALAEGRLPEPSAVRVEELVNAVDWSEPDPSGDDPLLVAVEVASAPWTPSHRLARVAIQARGPRAEERSAANLVVVVDTSAVMNETGGLDLARAGLRMLAERLKPSDRLAIVGYAREGVKTVLPTTAGGSRPLIDEAISTIRAGAGAGSIGGALESAYQMARGSRLDGGINRVILCQGSGQQEPGVEVDLDGLRQMVEQNQREGLSLSVFRFQAGEGPDLGLEDLARRGGGSFALIDAPSDVQQMLGENLGGPPAIVATDVMLQVEFNPATVSSYRLLGHEGTSEGMEEEQVERDVLLAGQNLVAFYEIVPAPVRVGQSEVVGLRYQKFQANQADDAARAELMSVSIGFKRPDGTPAAPIVQPVVDRGQGFAEASAEFRFSASVAELGLLLSRSAYRGDASFASCLQNARGSLGSDRFGTRSGLIGLIEKAAALSAGKIEEGPPLASPVP